MTMGHSLGMDKLRPVVDLLLCTCHQRVRCREFFERKALQEAVPTAWALWPLHVAVPGTGRERQDLPEDAEARQAGSSFLRAT